MPKLIDDAQVYRAAVQVFVARGYAGATMKEIAEVAQIHEASLFRKYGSKISLIERALRQQLADVWLTQLTYTGDLEGDLLAIVEAYQKTVHHQGDALHLLLMQASQNPELSFVVEIIREHFVGVLDTIQRYQASGQLQEEPPESIAIDLIAPLMVRNLLQRVVAGLPDPRPDTAAESAIFSFEARAYVAAFLRGKAVS